MKFSLARLFFSEVVVVLATRGSFAMGAPGVSSDPSPMPTALSPR